MTKVIQNMIGPKITTSKKVSMIFNVVPVEDILGVHNVDYARTESLGYTAEIWCHYISWALKIRLDHLNE